MSETGNQKVCIVNGDDFGASAGINRGVIEAHTNGILTSASLMINMPGTAEAIELAQKYVDEIQYRYLPSFNAIFAYSGSKNTAFAPGDPRWTITLGAQWLLWDGGVRESETRLREAQREAARIQEAKLRSQIDSDIKLAYADYLSSLNQVESGLTQVELAEEALRQARIAYKYGAATQLDLINAEDQMKIAKIALIQDQLAVELAVRELNQLAGL